MRHAEHEFLDAGLAARWISSLSEAISASAPSSEKRFWPDVLGVQVALQAFGRGQLREQIAALLGAEAMLHAAELELILQPQALVGIGDMRELGADVAAIDAAPGAR